MHGFAENNRHFAFATPHKAALVQIISTKRLN